MKFSLNFRALRTVENDQDERKPNDERKTAAFLLCKKNGIVAEHLEERNEMSETPLIREAAEGDERSIVWLLEAGSDHDARMDDELGYTAIHQAAYFGNSRCITQLIKYKADPCVLDRSGCTPLFVAATNGEFECIKVLLKAGAERMFDERAMRSSLEFFKEVQNAERKRAHDAEEKKHLDRLLRKSMQTSCLFV